MSDYDGAGLRTEASDDYELMPVVTTDIHVTSSTAPFEAKDEPAALSQSDSASDAAPATLFEASDLSLERREMQDNLSALVSFTVPGAPATRVTPNTSRRGSLREPRYKASLKGVRWELPLDHIDRENDPAPPKPQKYRRRILLEEPTPKESLQLYLEMTKQLKIKPLQAVIKQVNAVVSANQDRITVLSFKGIKSVVDPKRWHSIWELIMNCSSLQVLSFQGCRLSDKSMFSLSRGLLMRRCVEQLDLSDNRINLRGIEALIRLLASSHYLKMLDISGTQFDKKKAFVLGRALSVACNLETIVLHRCGFNVHQSLSLIIQSLMYNRTIKNLDLQYNDIDSKGVHIIAAWLMKKNLIQKLDLRHNKIGDDGCMFLASALNVNDSLRVVAIAANNIRESGMMKLLEAVKQNKGIEILDLSENPAGTNLVTDMLKFVLVSHPGIKKLKLNHMKITSQGAIAIAEAIADSFILEEVGLEGNKIEVAGVMALAHAMKVNQSVHTLSLSGINNEPDFSEKAREDIAAYCIRNRKAGPPVSANSTPVAALHFANLVTREGSMFLDAKQSPAELNGTLEEDDEVLEEKNAIFRRAIHRRDSVMLLHTRDDEHTADRNGEDDDSGVLPATLPTKDANGNLLSPKSPRRIHKPMSPTSRPQSFGMRTTMSEYDLAGASIIDTRESSNLFDQRFHDLDEDDEEHGEETGEQQKTSERATPEEELEEEEEDDGASEEGNLDNDTPKPMFVDDDLAEAEMSQTVALGDDIALDRKRNGSEVSVFNHRFSILQTADELDHEIAETEQTITL